MKLETYFRLVERPRPREQSVKSLTRWMEGNKPLALEESTFLNDWNDLVGPNDSSDHGGVDESLMNFAGFLASLGVPNVGNLP